MLLLIVRMFLNKEIIMTEETNSCWSIFQEQPIQKFKKGKPILRELGFEPINSNYVCIREGEVAG